MDKYIAQTIPTGDAVVHRVSRIGRWKDANPFVAVSTHDTWEEACEARDALNHPVDNGETSG